MKQMR